MAHKLAAVKEQLLERKQELEERLAELGQEKFSDGHVADTADQALSSSMESLKSSLQNSAIDEYKRVVSALRMIEAGTYGICVDCDQAISSKRLKAFPNATRCIACQEQHEKS